MEQKQLGSARNFTFAHWSRTGAVGLLTMALVACSGGSGGSSTVTPPAAAAPPASSEAPAIDTGNGANTTSPAVGVTVKTLTDDMTLAHDASPEGVAASAWWAAGAAVPAPVAPASAKGLTGFGVLAVAAGSTVAAGTHVELRNFETFAYDGTRWKRVQYSEQVNGAYYSVPAYSANPAAAQVEIAPPAMGTAGSSRVTPRSGFIYRFWPRNGVAADASEGGVIQLSATRTVFSTVQARVVREGSTADYALEARVLVQLGAAWGGAAQSELLPGAAGVVDAGLSRFRLLGTGWDAYGFSSSGTAALPSLPVVVPLAATGQATRVMAIGDSITQGRNLQGEVSPSPYQESFRRFLWQEFVQEAVGARMEMVGSRTGLANQPSGCGVTGIVPADGVPRVRDYDQNHESFYAWCTDDVTPQIEALAADVVADVALIHLGTNDVQQIQHTPDQIAVSLEKLLAVLRARNPTIRVHLSELIASQDMNPQLQQANVAIRALASRLSTAASPVRVVQQQLTAPADLVDGTHPNDVGARKMADAFYGSLAPELN